MAEQINKAQKALVSGDGEKAVAATEKAAEQLRAMKEAGTESDIVLTGMAMKLKQLGIDAAKLNQSQLIDKKQAENDISELDLALSTITKKEWRIPIRVEVIGDIPSFSKNLANTEDAAKWASNKSGHRP